MCVAAAAQDKDKKTLIQWALGEVKVGWGARFLGDLRWFFNILDYFCNILFIMALVK